MVTRIYGTTETDTDYVAPSVDRALSKQRVMALIIGTIALSLAFVVAWLDLVAWTGTPPAAYCARSSISHYFYEPVAGTAFVMALTFVSAFMLAFRGETFWQAVVASIGGFGGLMLAFFPTSGLGCDAGATIDVRAYALAVVPSELSSSSEIVTNTFQIASQTAYIAPPWSQTLHMAGAVLMFVSLGVLCILFTRINKDRDLKEKENPGDPDVVKPGKFWRNKVYILCCGVMLVGFFMIVRNEHPFSRELSRLIGLTFSFVPGTNDDLAMVIRPVFHGEKLALLAFSVAWIVKGHFWLIKPRSWFGRAMAHVRGTRAS